MSDYELSGDHGDQLSLDQDVPVAGELYRRKGTASIACVLATSRARRVEILLRINAEERWIPLVAFRQHYDRCRPDGSLL
jgi:hypothetical protein